MATNTPFGQRLGLVLEGGAMRGMFSAGVMDVMMENGIRFDGIIGVSAGAAFGVNYKSGQIGRAIRYNANYCHGCGYVAGQKGRSIRYYRKYRSDKHFMGLYSLLTTGDVVGTKFCYEDIPLRLDPFDEAAFEKAPVDFYVTVTNVRTGKPEYILCDELKVGSKMDVIRAGASMPLCSKMVEWNGNLYLDGGVSDSIPYAKMKDFGCRKSIVVLTQPAGYLKQPAAMAPFEAMYRKYPAFVEAMRGRDQMYNTEVCAVEQAAKQGDVFLIRPSKLLHVGRMEHDIEVLNAQYELGRQDARNQMDAMREWMER